MAIGVLTNAQVIINGVDLSDHCSSVSLEDSRNQVDITAMGALNVTYAKGLGDAKATFDAHRRLNHRLYSSSHCLIWVFQ